MNKQMIKGRIVSYIAAIGFAASGLLSAGCVGGETDLESVESAAQALTLNTAGPFGRTTGTVQGPASDLATPITKIVAYAHANGYIHGLRLYWGDQSVMYGQTNGAPGETIVIEAEDGEVVKEVKVYVDASSILRGIRLKTNFDAVFTAGYLNAPYVTAFSCQGCAWTDMKVFSGPVNNIQEIHGGAFNYTTP